MPIDIIEDFPIVPSKQSPSGSCEPKHLRNQAQIGMRGGGCTHTCTCLGRMHTNWGHDHIKMAGCTYILLVQDSTNIGDGLEMSPSGSSEIPSLVLMDKSSKSTSSDDNNDRNLKKEET